MPHRRSTKRRGTQTWSRNRAKLRGRAIDRRPSSPAAHASTCCRRPKIPSPVHRPLVPPMTDRIIILQPVKMVLTGQVHGAIERQAGAPWRCLSTIGSISKAMTPMTSLTMRPTGLGHGVYKDAIDYSVFSGDWEIERKGFPEDVRFFWSLHGICSDQPAQH